MSPQTALITGAANGIGLAVAQALAQQGHRVLVTDLDGNSAAQAAKQLRSGGGQASAHRLDVTSQTDIDALFGEVGDIGILINNAGLQHVARLEQFPVERWKLLIDVLLTGPAMLTRAALPSMRANGFGRIINIGSIHSLVASPYKSAYVAAKHGLLGFAKTVALETADQDITINTICPAYVRTALVEQQIRDQAREHGISEQQVIDDIMLQPMAKKSFISPAEICGTIDYLLSPASRNMTGQQIVLDGAWTAR